MKLNRLHEVLTQQMTNHRLSIEQKFQLEAAFRDIDACDDIGKLREITKAIITAQENEKAFAREAISRMRQEIDVQTISSFGFNRAAGWKEHDQLIAIFSLQVTTQLALTSDTDYP